MVFIFLDRVLMKNNTLLDELLLLTFYCGKEKRYLKKNQYTNMKRPQFYTTYNKYFDLMELHAIKKKRIKKDNLLFNKVCFILDKVIY